MYFFGGAYFRRFFFFLRVKIFIKVLMGSLGMLLAPNTPFPLGIMLLGRKAPTYHIVVPKLIFTEGKD